MTDKEVGELWTFFNGFKEAERQGGAIYDMMRLIRKLVEERGLAYGGTPDDFKQALRDFGIDPETF